VAADEDHRNPPLRETVALALRLIAAICIIALGLGKDGVEGVVVTIVGVGLFFVWVWLERRAPSRP
jgi:uncharacterized membrane protein